MLATLVVNVNSDAGPITDDGNLLLREAIAYVNGITPGPLDLAQIDITQPLGQNDGIVFASNLNGATIALDPNLASLVISKPVNIDGPSNRVTILPAFTPGNDRYGLIYNIVTGSAATSNRSRGA